MMTPTDEQSDKKMVWIHLDQELYYDSDDITTFLIFTKEQYDKVKKWTLENMRKTGGFSEEDYKKLE